MTVELPTVEEVKEWLNKDYGHLNPDILPFFLLGVQAMYEKLGGDKLILIVP